ncbi:RNA polymerase sigma-70 factor [Pedobacter sp. PWIIR3]
MASSNISVDLNLFTLIKAGNVDAFTEIYNRYFDLLYIHALKRVRDEDAAKDLIQDLFTALWNKREKLDQLTNPSHYLYTATRNGVLNYIARQKVESAYTTALPNLEAVGINQTDYLTREKQLQALIDKEVGELPEKMRLIFQLSRSEGLSHKEIAVRLGLSELTVKTQVKNALRILRGKLGIVLYLLMVFGNK